MPLRQFQPVMHQVQILLRRCNAIVRFLLEAMQGASKNSHFIPTAMLQKKFLADISTICGAAKFFLRLAFGRTLNF
jgi:hypothetical protein